MGSFPEVTEESMQRRIAGENSGNDPILEATRSASMVGGGSDVGSVRERTCSRLANMVYPGAIDR